MKRTLLTAVLALGSLTAVAAFAQAPDAQATPQHHRMHNPHKAAMRLGKKLNLSPDQTAKLEPILAQRRDQEMAIRNNTALSPDQQRARMRDLKRNTHQQIAGVLTPEQTQQWKAMRKEHRHKQDGAGPVGA